MKDLLDLAKDAVLFVFWMTTGLARRAARGLAHAAKRSLKAMAQRADRPPRPAAAPRPPRSRLVALAGWLVAACVLYGGAAWIGVWAGNSLMANAQFEPPGRVDDDSRFKLASHVFAADGEVIYEIAEENRDYVTYEQISPYVVEGLIAVEDEQFRDHIGLNPRGLARAAVNDIEASIKARRLVFPEGGSSLTQQLAKQLFLTPEKKFKRKVTEALYALHIEQDVGKNQILERYLNKVYFGEQCYGVEAASQFYFGKPCRDVSLAEGALLAGLPQRPSDLSPVKNPDGAQKRRNKVLDRMVAAGKITPEAAAAAKAEPIVIARTQTARRLETQQAAPFFVEDIRRDLLERPATKDVLMTGGLEIETTLDMDLQRKATLALREGLRRLDKQLSEFRPIQRNLVVEGVDPEAYEDPLWLLPLEVDNVLPGVVLESDATSAIVRIGADRVKVDKDAIAWTKRRTVSDVLHRGDLAPFRLIGRDSDTGAIRGVQLEQDPLLEGAIVVLDVTSGEILAMAGGYDYNRSEFNKATQARRQAGSSFKPIYYAAALERGLRPSTTALDEPTTFVDAWTGELYQPENYHLDYKGRVTLREALELSLNIPSVRMLNYIGYKDAIATAKRFGLSGEMRPYPSMALGAFEMTLLEMTSAYAVFPNGGVHVEPTMLRRVRDAKGNVLHEHAVEAVEVISPQVAWQMVQMLRGVVQSGTAKDAKSLGRHVAGKTGTTDDYTDAWFIGFTPSVAVGVWTGYEKELKTIGRDYSGSRAALPIWIDFMRAYFEGRPEEQFMDPGGIEIVAIHKTTGLVASEDCVSDLILESFVEGNRPIRSCTRARHQELVLPRCLQRFGMDEAGYLVVQDERQLFDLEANPAGCPVVVDPIDRVVQFAWSPIAPRTQYPYRIGVMPVASNEDSIEALMSADRRTTRDGLHSDFDILDGRSVIVVRNDR